MEIGVHHQKITEVFLAFGSDVSCPDLQSFTIVFSGTDQTPKPKAFGHFLPEMVNNKYAGHIGKLQKFPSRSTSGLLVCAAAFIAGKIRAQSVPKDQSPNTIFMVDEAEIAKTFYNILNRSENRMFVDDVFGHSGDDGVKMLSKSFRATKPGNQPLITLKHKVETQVFVGNQQLTDENVLNELFDAICRHHRDARPPGSRRFEQHDELEWAPLVTLPAKHYSKFIDRDETTKLRIKLQSDEPHLVICGVPGIGKRTLFHHVFTAILSSDDGGAQFCDRFAYIDLTNSPQSWDLFSVQRQIAKLVGVESALKKESDSVWRTTQAAMVSHQPIVVFEGLERINDPQVIEWVCRGCSGWKFVILTNCPADVRRLIRREEIYLQVRAFKKHQSEAFLNELICSTYDEPDRIRIQALVPMILEKVEGNPLLLRNTLARLANDPDASLDLKDLEEVWEESWKIIDDGDRKILFSLANSPGGLTIEAITEITGESRSSTSKRTIQLYRLGFLDQSFQDPSSQTPRYFIYSSARGFIATHPGISESEDRKAILERTLDHAARKAKSISFNWSSVQRFTSLEASGEIENYRYLIELADQHGLMKKAGEIAKSIVYFQYTRGDSLSSQNCPIAVWIRSAEVAEDYLDEYEAQICKLNVACKAGNEFHVKSAKRRIEVLRGLIADEKFTMDMQHRAAHAEALYQCFVGNHDEAICIWKRLLSSSDLDKKTRSASQRWLAEGYLKKGGAKNINLASKLYEDDIRFADDNNFPRPKISAMIGLAKIALSRKKSRSNSDLIAGYIEKLEEMNGFIRDQIYHAEILELKGRFAFHQGEIEKELDFKRQASQAFRSLGYEDRANKLI